MWRSKISRVVAVIAYLALVAGFAAGVWRAGYGGALDQLESRGRSDLALAADRLTSQFQLFRELAFLLAEHPDLRPDAAVAPAADVLLRSVADKTGALDILVLDAAGNERASAGRPLDEQLPEGSAQNGDYVHAMQPYFERVMDGALALYHYVDTRYYGQERRQGRRVLIFAAPIFGASGPVTGAVVVLVDVERIEADWRGGKPTVFFTDDLGTVFISNRSELVLTARRPPQRAQSRSAALPPAGPPRDFVQYETSQFDSHEIWHLDGGRYIPQTALHISLPLPTISMTGEALIDVTPARQLANWQAAAVAALCLAFGALLFLATERRRTLAEANTRLEARVRARTAALSELNTDLRREVAERTAAEAQLQKAQADLVQAGKLSALGQMSAGISHELNQPLMAIRSFAENGQALLERGQQDAADQNLSRISELAQRMGRIIRNLRAFARQEGTAIGRVDLGAAIDAAIEMAGPKLRQSDVQLFWAPPSPTYVRGGDVRLAQVVLNLISNAVDAMEGLSPKQVHISVEVIGPRAILEVRDTGPGIAEPERIFDPFYTTKPVGPDEGMGLGLSISYGLVQSFGGVIRGRNYAGAGAVFTVELDLYEEAQAA